MAIVTTGHDVADARLHRTAGALQRAGFDVSIRGLGDASDAPPGCDVVTAPRCGQLGRVFRALTWPWRVSGDVVLTIDPDTAASAWLAARVRRRPWVADVHEDYAALLRDRAWVPRPLLALLQGAVGALNALMSRADLLLVADEHVPPRRGRGRTVMRNEPDFSFLPAPTPREPGQPWRAVYIGDNRTSRGLRTMIEAVRATADDASPWQLDIIGPVAAADREWFEAGLSQRDARHVTWHGRHAPHRAWEIARGADVGLCLLADTPAFREAMPSKVYEYLAAGMPTIATPLPRVVELLRRTGAGVVVEGADETAAALRRFADDPLFRADLVAAAGEARGAALSRRNTYDEAAAKIRALV